MTLLTLTQTMISLLKLTSIVFVITPDQGVIVPYHNQTMMVPQSNQVFMIVSMTTKVPVNQLQLECYFKYYK